MAKARHSSICPVCGIFIAKNHSQPPVALTEHLPLHHGDPAASRNAAARGYEWGSRVWVHAYCWNEGERILEALRRPRIAELQERQHAEVLRLLAERQAAKLAKAEVRAARQARAKEKSELTTAHHRSLNEGD